ncbi:MAG: hypothetical protein OXE87_17125 [Chloroflexi bacterium]|nr:hypothetical protein [Chloroflexota bacterium]
MSQSPNNEIDEAVTFLLELVNDLSNELESLRRIEAASIAAKLGGDAAAIEALVELAEGFAVESYAGAARLEVAREVAKLGDAESSVEILAAICEDDDLGWDEREEAAQEILRMGDTGHGVSGINAVLYFANESGVDMGIDEAEYRTSAAERMAEAGQIEAAVEVLKVITQDGVWSEHNRFSRVNRWNAAVTLSNLGDESAAAKAFFSLAVDDDINAGDQERLDAALMVAELGHWEKASEALVTVAAECEHEEIRLKAAIQVASHMDQGTERAIEIIGTLLARRYSYHQLTEAQMEREVSVDDQTPSLALDVAMTDQEKAWALILEATKILYPRAFTS